MAIAQAPVTPVTGELENEAVRQTAAAKGAAGAKAAGATGAKLAGAKAAAVPGVEQEVLREALATKAATAKGLGAAGAATAGTKGAALVAGKGTGLIGQSAAQGGTALTGAQALTTGGTIWTGKGLSLGLGIGLGAWGPALVLAGGAAAVYAYMQYRKRQQELAPDEDSDELNDALADSGVIPTAR